MSRRSGLPHGAAEIQAAEAKSRQPSPARTPLLLFLLALLTLATFWPALSNDFIFYDDDVYVTQNPAVHHGLTWAGVGWALTTGRAANWHPLTWLSHMADVSLFGMNPAGHHAMNVAFHVANTLLLFLALRSLTGAVWRSAFVAALFAVHPAHVESVAWVAERKDLLSTLFWITTMWAYGSWVHARTRGRYALVLILFAAGVMSKPMVVTLPLVLLLLDYWPLERFTPGKSARALLWRAPDGSSGLIREKVPLFLVAAASSVVTFFVQRAGGAVGSLKSYPLGVRLANALVAYARYLRILVWPRGLAIFYPHPGSTLPGWKILGAAFLLAALSAAAILLRRSAPFLLVGWFWFLVTLVPVIGLVQVGWQAMADRYTYVSFIGLFIAVAWGASAAVSRWRPGVWALRVAAAAALLALAIAAAAQVRYWRNSETLFLHALSVTGDNFLAQNNLGDYYNEIGKPSVGLPHLQEAIRIRPDASEAYSNLGKSLFLLGRLDEAARDFSESLRLRPDNEIASNNLARVRFLQGDIAEAARLYGGVAAAAPDWGEVRERLAVALLMEGKTAAAIDQLERLMILEPKNSECLQLLAGARALAQGREDSAANQLRLFLANAHRQASVALQKRGKRAEALAQLQRALALVPSLAEAHDDLGALLLQDGRVDEATAQFQQALNADPKSAAAHNNIGYILFLKGRTKEAIDQYVEALRLRPGLPLAQNNLERALREENREKLPKRQRPPSRP